MRAVELITSFWSVQVLSDLLNDSDTKFESLLLLICRPLCFCGFFFKFISDGPSVRKERTEDMEGKQLFFQ